MTVSNSFNFSLTRNDIIYEAYRLASLIDPVETLTSTEITNASQSLNLILKNLMARGVKVWTYEEAILIPEIGKAEYSINPTGDRVCLKSDFIKTTLGVAIASGNTSFTVASGAGIAISDTIGVLKDGAFTWRTVSNVVGNVITVSTAFASAFAVDSKVYSYTARIAKPLRVCDAIMQYDENSSIAMAKISMTEWQNQNSKLVGGNPTMYHYQPQIDSGQFFINPSPIDESQYINLIIEKPFDDLDTSTDTIPTPNEYYDIIIYTLAERLAFANGFYSKASILGAKASQLTAYQESHDYEDSSMIIGFSEGQY